MHVDVRKADDVVIVDLEGKLLSGVGDELLREVINELLAEGWKKILLNLSGVSAIDSSGVGELVASLRTSKAIGAGIKATRLGGRVERVLRLSALLPLLDVYPTEEEALAAFAAEDTSQNDTAEISPPPEA